MRKALRVSRSISFVVIAMAMTFTPVIVASAQTRDTPPPRLPATAPSQVQMGVRDGRPPVPRTGTGIIRGRVVDGVTAQPIPRVRVRLSGDVTKGPILTDRDGMFAFTALPQGAYFVSTEKSTYLAGRHPDQQRSIRNRLSVFMLGPGQELDDITVSMFHSGAIAGRVVDAHGDPIESASVSIMAVARGGRPQQRGSGVTNDLGEFRLSRLMPGRYIVRVRAQPTYGAEISGEAPLPQPLPVYFPSALAPEQAHVIAVNRGETVTGVDITMAEGIPTIVSGMVVSVDGQPFSGGFVNFRSASTVAFGGFEGGGIGVRPDGSFRAQLPPGEYIVEARAQPGRTLTPMLRPESALFGSVRVAVSGENVEGLTILVGTGATAAGRVIFEGKTPPAPPTGEVRLPMFNPNGPGCDGNSRATIGADWTFKVEGLSGTCMAQPEAMFGGWRLKALMIGDENLADKSITFQPGHHYADVRVIATDKRTTVEFHVTDESGQATREYAVMMFSTDKTKWTQGMRPVRTTSPPPISRSSQLPPGAVRAQGDVNRDIVRLVNLPTGDYYAVAVDDLDPDDAQDPAILEKLVPSAVKVAVTDEGPLEVALRRVRAAEAIR